MTYTLYIPDTDTTFRRQEFADLKELARWAMEAALGAPTTSPTSATPAAPELNISEKETSTNWFDGPDNEEYARLYKTAVDAKDWVAVGNQIMTTIYEKSFENTYVLERDDLQIIVAFLKFVVTHLPLCMSHIDSDNPIKWAQLPTECIDACLKYIDDQGEYRHSSLKGISQLFLDYKSMYAVFEVGKTHSSWSKENLEFECIEWGDATGLTNHIMTHWLGGAQPSDHMQQFIVKLFIAQRLSKQKSKTIGVTEFYEIVTQSDNLIVGLPKKFCKWVLTGINRTHMKEAMEAMGVTQTRRAEGQRFIDVGFTAESPSSTFAWKTIRGLSVIDTKADMAPFSAPAWIPTEEDRVAFLKSIKQNGGVLDEAAIAQFNATPKEPTLPPALADAEKTFTVRSVLLKHGVILE